MIQILLYHPSKVTRVWKLSSLNKSYQARSLAILSTTLSKIVRMSSRLLHLCSTEF
jgi:hypothetical protein